MFPLREEGNLPLQGLLSDLLRLTHDGHGVDVEVELVGREAPPAAGAVLQPELGEVGGAKVADSAKHLSCRSLSSSGKKNKFGHFLGDVQLIRRLTKADISCTTTARLFFFPLLVP